LCRIPALVTPFAVFRVAPQLLEHGIDDVVRAAIDESRIVVEEFSNRRLDPDFSRDDDGLLLDECHSAFPPVAGCGASETPGRGKKAGTVCVPKGGSDLASFGRLKAEQVGSLPPDLTFFPGLFLFSPCSKSFPMTGFQNASVKNAP
jgi:hypothetical protein